MRGPASQRSRGLKASLRDHRQGDVPSTLRFVKPTPLGAHPTFPLAQFDH